MDVVVTLCLSYQHVIRIDLVASVRSIRKSEANDSKLNVNYFIALLLNYVLLYLTNLYCCFM